MVTKVPNVLEFFDLVTKKRFKTSDFKIVFVKSRGGKRKAAVAISPSNNKTFRFLPK